jgi:hypothetical protein
MKRHHAKTRESQWGTARFPFAIHAILRFSTHASRYTRVPVLRRTLDRRFRPCFFLTRSLSRRNYNSIIVEADFLWGMVSAEMGFRPFSPLVRKRNFEDLHQGVLDEK